MKGFNQIPVQRKNNKCIYAEKTVGDRVYVLDGCRVPIISYAPGAKKNFVMKYRCADCTRRVMEPMGEESR